MTIQLSAEERISDADLAVISNVIKNFKLPETAIPDWAKVVPEEAWLPKISTSLFQALDLDDIWADSDEDPISYQRSMANREWKRLHEQHGNAGYKEGIVEGKDLTVQEGFNRGYSEGVTVGKEIGELRGTLSTLITFYTQTSSTEIHATTHLARLRALHDEISAISIEHIFAKEHFYEKEERIRVGTASRADGCCRGADEGGACCGGPGGEEMRAEGCGCGTGGGEVDESPGANIVDPVVFVTEYRRRVDELVTELGL
ncbi:hypothetical protein BC938DRAFT_478495 [Jimgerdemannia flammicorona]|uniref:Protein YAE1 n=1 Tax=Jimgerdemannia flammicorona TaxID=994334 RepID=A0A433QMS9_9FUNG|nr:hypothetical protein BC938DRAFT_478495 [Jimgerdemannia flammicorona]